MPEGHVQSGDKGFQVDVKGGTDLKGAVIASTEKAVEDSQNKLTTNALTQKNVENKAEYQADSSQVGVNVNKTDGINNLRAAHSSQEDSKQSVTRSGVSGKDPTTDAQGDPVNTEVRAGDKANGIDKIFDKEKAERAIAAQTEIRAEASKRLPKAIGDYAVQKQKELLEEAGKAKTLEERKALMDEAQKWAEGGVYRVELHTLAGGIITGDVSGAIGAGTSAVLTPKIARVVDKLEVSEDMKSALIALIVTATATVGGEVLEKTGVEQAGQNMLSTATSVAVNNHLTHEEKRLLAEARKRLLECKDDDCRAKEQNEIGRLIALHAEREAYLKPISELCKRVPGLNTCEAIANYFNLVNQYSALSQMEESTGKTGTPFSFNGCPESDKKGGCSYGPWQLASMAGGLEAFFNYLKKQGKAGSEDSAFFLRELNSVGGLEAARNAKQEGGLDSPFVKKWMELTRKSGQFIQDQFESINQTNMLLVRDWADKHMQGFEQLDPEVKSALFSQVVQMGTVGPKRSLRYVLSERGSNANGFSPKTYTKNENDFGLKEGEYDRALSEQVKLNAKRESSIKEQRDSIKEQRDSIKERASLTDAKLYYLEKKELLTRGQLGKTSDKIRKLDRDIERIDGKVAALDERVERAGARVSASERKVEEANRRVVEAERKADENQRQVDGLRAWMLERTRVATEDTELFINYLYDSRIKLRPSEKERYERERNTLLRQYRERKAREEASSQLEEREQAGQEEGDQGP